MGAVKVWSYKAERTGSRCIREQKDEEAPPQGLWIGVSQALSVLGSPNPMSQLRPRALHLQCAQE